MPGAGGYTKKKGNRMRRSPMESLEQIGQNIQVIKNEIDEIYKPSGNKKNPARYCKDMYRCNNNYKNGEAVFTFCVFCEGRPCVDPFLKRFEKE